MVPDTIFSLEAGLSFATGVISGSVFTWSPGIGIKLSKKIDLALKYQSIRFTEGNCAFAGLRLGISL